MLRIVLIVLAVLMGAPAWAQGAANTWPAGSLAAVTYSPRNVNFAILTSYVSPGQIEADLALLATVTKHIRTYTVDRGMDQLPAIARRYGMRVSLGLWLGTDPQRNAREIALGLAAVRANRDVIDRVFVGNETLYRNDLTEEQLRAYLGEVRAGMPDRRIQVTTAEQWHGWLMYPRLAEVCDVIAAHITPYTNGVSIDQATDDVVERYEMLRKAFPGKAIVIAETGWPARGQTYQAAVPSPEAQIGYLKRFTALAAARGYEYYALEGFDQPWKVTVDGDVGAHWGLFDTAGRAKWREPGAAIKAP